MHPVAARNWRECRWRLAYLVRNFNPASKAQDQWKFRTRVTRARPDKQTKKGRAPSKPRLQGLRISRRANHASSPMTTIKGTMIRCVVLRAILKVRTTICLRTRGRQSVRAFWHGLAYTQKRTRNYSKHAGCTVRRKRSQAHQSTLQTLLIAITSSAVLPNISSSAKQGPG